MTEVKRDCKTCFYSVEMRITPESIEKALTCMHSPPTASYITMPQGIQVAVMFPQVQPGQWCFQYHPKPADQQPPPKIET